MPVKTLVEHWNEEVKAFTKRETDAKAEKENAAKALATAKADLDKEEKVFTDLAKAVGETRTALAKAGAAEAAALAKKLLALIVDQHNSEGRRLQLGRALDVAQADADLAADKVADASAGLGEASGKLAAAQTAKAKRDERIAKLTASPLKDVAARVATEGEPLVQKAWARVEVIPKELRDQATQRHGAEVKFLDDASAAASQAGDDKGKADGAGGGDGAVVADAARRFALAEESLATWLDTTVPDLDAAIASLTKIVGKDGDPPLLSKAEEDAIKKAAGGGSGGYGARTLGAERRSRAAAPTKDGADQSGASGSPTGAKDGSDPLDVLVETTEPGSDSTQAPPAAPETPVGGQDQLEALVPDKVWQVILDILQAERVLTRVKGGLKNKVAETEEALAQAKTTAGEHRRGAEDRKHEARKTAKRLEKAKAAHEGRLLSAVRGDF
jgi:hypothetical protein